MAINFLKNNKYFLMGLGLVIFVIWINRFPDGYVFAGGDTDQYINLKEYFKAYFFDWQGRAVTFYGIFYILDILEVSSTAQISYHLVYFLLGSYISFSIFSRLILKTSDFKRVTISLFYSLNLYTLFIFTGNWGYSYFPSLYVYLPVLLGLYVAYLKTSQKKYIYLFGIALFFSSSGFGNPAFFISFCIFLFIITVSLMALKLRKADFNLAKDISIAILILLIVNLYWIMPLIPQLKSGVESVFNSDVLELNWVISHDSSPVFYDLSLLHFSEDHFPFNFPYKNILFLKNIFLLLSFAPIFLVITFLPYLRRLNKWKRKYFIAMIIMLIFFVMLAARVVYPFESINHFLYNIWGMNTMRNFDKTGIYIPFILSTLLLIIISEIRNKKTVASMAFLLLIIPLPFYIGKIQQNLSYRFSSASVENQDYQKSKYSFLVKIPNEYFQIKETINNDFEKSFIATLPKSRDDGSGISNYPAWKLYGADITKFLYNKSILDANGKYFNDWLFAADFNNDEEDFDWIVKLLGIMNVKYILYHKDAPEKSVLQSEYKMKMLEEEGMIKSLSDNEYFTLYKVVENYFTPYIVWQKEEIKIDPDEDSVRSSFDKIKSVIQLADFQQVNPKKYTIKLNGSSENNIILAEPYNQNWKAYYISKSGKEIEIEDHFTARGYANGWKIDSTEAKNAEEILIEFYPIRLMWKGISISVLSLLILVILLIRKRYTDKKSNV